MDTVKVLSSFFEGMRQQKSAFIKHTIAVYLFGSFATGEQDERSDIDLAFILTDDFYKKDPFSAMQQMEILSLKLRERTKRVIDGTILNGASLGFAYHTVRQGICVYERNTAQRILYEVSLDNKYQDFRPFIQELRDIKRRELIGRD